MFTKKFKYLIFSLSGCGECKAEDSTKAGCSCQENTGKKYDQKMLAEPKKPTQHR